jgi:hypothetical protein
MRDYKKELEDDLAFARKNNFRIILVEANHKKNFDYSYFLYLPDTDNAKNVLMMDCLNDYESVMPDGYKENLEGIEEVYNLFEPGEIIRGETLNTNGKEENKEQTLNRLYYRLEDTVNSLSNMIGINPNVPAIVPIIPGYVDEKFENVASQLDKDVISKIAPQIKAMIEDARKIAKERAGINLSDKVVPLGHSKSATFANNFSAYYPEMCEASMLGGGKLGTLPIDEIALQIVPDNEISDSEKFMLINGKVTKKITQADLDRITQEYNNSKRDYQAEITINEDGTYNLPMNFPIGISDIEHYKDLSNFPDGKEGYRKALLNMPKMLFNGEQEDTVPGHFAYMDGTTLEGINVKAGENISPIEEKLNRKIDEIEIASMHNRVLEYINASNALFGKSLNERIGSYMQLYSLINMPVQSKIYEGVGHANFEYSGVIKGLDGITSKSIYTSETLKNDKALYYNGVVQGSIPILDDTDRADRISPIPQLIRRYIASGKNAEFLSGITEKQMMNALQEYINSQSRFNGKNIDRVYDKISASDIANILQTLEKNKTENTKRSELKLEGVDSQEYEEQYSGKTISAQDIGREVYEQIKDKDVRDKIKEDIEKDMTEYEHKKSNIQDEVK